MWLFSKAGFFSVVKSEKGEETLVVRSRIAGDLEDLRAKYMPKLGPTVQLPGRDYPYRAFIEKEAFAEGMVRLVLDIDYGNFKSMVMQVAGLARETLYAQVWGVMFNAEEKIRSSNRRAKTKASQKSML